MYYLGIDSGGTKTAFTLINENGDILATSIQGTAHVDQVGFEGLENTFSEGIKAVCTCSNITIDDLSFTFAGIPAYGENASYIPRMEACMRKIIGSNAFKCGNDVVAGWAGSLACKPGINLILGTGAIALGVNSTNHSVRSSGWGHVCGDEGSAYWIAKKGIELFGKESDGRLPKTVLYDIFKSELNLTTDFDLIYLVLDTYKQDRGKVAQLAKLVYAAAAQGDAYAIKIFADAAYECFLMISAITKQLDFVGPVPVSYSGSVFNSGKLVLEPLTQYLKEHHINAILEPPILTPDKGSALYALKLHNPELDLNHAIQKLQEK
ncbi:MAG: N-acetylglucosamine kinase [Cellulosilyticaceae bacterium]